MFLVAVLAATHKPRACQQVRASDSPLQVSLQRSGPCYHERRNLPTLNMTIGAGYDSSRLPSATSTASPPTRTF